MPAQNLIDWPLARSGFAIRLVIPAAFAFGPKAGAQVLQDLRIEGPTAVMENSTTDYTAIATFSNGDEFEVTLSCEWSVSPVDYASIDEFGYLTTGPKFAGRFRCASASPKTSECIRLMFGRGIGG